MAGVAPYYTVVSEDTTESPSTQELRVSLEKGADEERLDTQDYCIDDQWWGKKLPYFYREVCPKYGENGKLKREMILVLYVDLSS
ncbi:hypothetical protein EV424DRAFT_1544664 [Suillus variegatus]|nr:hypothetical protein EV424DRAFT_1544664 [Suillus variegatus]